MKNKLIFLFNAIKSFDYSPNFIIPNLVWLGVILFIVLNGIFMWIWPIIAVSTGIVLTISLISYGLYQIIDEYSWYIQYNMKLQSTKPGYSGPVISQWLPSQISSIDTVPVIDETPDGKYIIINGKKYIKSMMKDSIIQWILNKSLNSNSTDLLFHQP